jgi:carboxymethylenebutenolidase
MDNGEYLRSEVVLDYSDGIISRREALRRLVLMGLSAAASSSILAACARNETPPRQAAASAASPTPAASSEPGKAQAITFAGKSGTLQGAWAPAREVKGAVLIIHENRGQTDHTRSVASRFAADGYSALAIDLLSEEGGTASLGDDARATAALAAAPPERFVADMRSGLDELARRSPGKKLAIVGFCFGGGQVWSLLAAGEPRLAAAVPFYGPAPANPDFSKSKAAVLAIYAELDARVGATREGAVQGLEKAGLVHEVKIYPGVDHAFFNDTGPRYNAEQATRAYRDVLDWFGRYLR